MICIDTAKKNGIQKTGKAEKIAQARWLPLTP